MPKKLGFGVVGCGVIGPVHASAISRLPDAQLIGTADVDAARAKKLADQYGAKPYGDLQEFLANKDIDVVDVCVPSGLHGEVAIAAMRAGKHVIVEKPMDIKLEVADRMLECAKETGRKMAVISQARFSLAAQKVRKAIDNGDFGRLLLGNAFVIWFRTQEYYDAGGWRGTWAMDGGGSLMNQSVHSVDMLRWLMGPADTVYGKTAILNHKIEAEDAALALVTFKNGGMGVILGTTVAYDGQPQRVDIYGEKGSAIIEKDALTYWKFKDGEKEPPAGTAGWGPSASSDPRAGLGPGHELQIQDMIEAIHENRRPYVDGNEARNALEMVLAVYHSARTGQPVKLPL